MDRKQYERDLKKRQKQHLDNIKMNQDRFWKPCTHDQCPSCVGTGIRFDGSLCIHNLYCDCPKCSIHCSVEISNPEYGEITIDTTRLNTTNFEIGNGFNITNTGTIFRNFQEVNSYQGS